MKFAWLLAFPIAFALAQVSGVDPDARVGFESITAADLRTYLTYLASDSLQGRETSYPGEHMAAAYIADHFKTFGLRPMGDGGTFLQHYLVDLIKVSDSTSMTLRNVDGSQRFSWESDFTSFAGRDTSLSGGVAFVGYMDSGTPPEQKSALAGKFILVLNGSRPGAPPAPSGSPLRRAFGGGRRDSGAVAMLVVAADTGALSLPRIVSTMVSFGVAGGRMTLKGENPRPLRAGPLSFIVSPAFADAILRSGGTSLAEARRLASEDSLFYPMVFSGVSLSLDEKMLRQEREAENVVGLLEGSDPVMKKDVVVFSAHFDHLGVGPGGAIFHGADDNGSGTSMVIELAHAFASNPVRPKCSLLFLGVSGEEKGLLGSSYYTSHPEVPLENTVADFNTDMIGRMDSIHQASGSGPYVYVIGSDKISTELDSVLRVANAESNNIALDYDYDNDRDPHQYYKRSDHYNFARHGVPIAFFFTGEHADYHRPTDTIDKILFDRIVKIGQVVYYAGWKTANLHSMLARNGTGEGYRETSPTRGE
ncbi:MAG TPA: M28 family peptidase [Bacteroidota bacterium]|nr:M28 family peptidase [Bacteroidota bacterium]